MEKIKPTCVREDGGKAERRTNRLYHCGDSSLAVSAARLPFRLACGARRWSAAVSLAGGSGQPDLTPASDRDKRNATTMTL